VSPVPIGETLATLARFLPKEIAMVSVPRVPASPDAWRALPAITELLAGAPGQTR